MGKHSKLGKQRQDKFYYLAKEAGYRSRSAFKLLQLNRKFTFLQKSRVCVDLCAAPGGWLQVASENMPIASIIIGVDIVPIRPIRNVETIQDDITSDSCVKTLKEKLKTWKADVVLHDGSPNVGQNWMFDAFQQATLTLRALHLSTEILNKGGWFVSKIFRSKDYDALIWVFKKFFKKVYVTKPQASRLESAEIFVVCAGYVAPEKIDPKFLNPKSIFAEVDAEPPLKKEIARTKKSHNKAEGYSADDRNLFCKTAVSSFITGNNPVVVLANCNELVFDNDDVLHHPSTTSDIKEYCKDIKVLGRKEFKILMKWRKLVAEEVYEKMDKKSQGQLEDKKVEEDVDEEKQIEKAIEEAQLAEARELKQKKRKLLKKRKKLYDKMNLGMVIKNDEPITEHWHDTFSLNTIKNADQLKNVENTWMSSVDDFLQDTDLENSESVTVSKKTGSIPKKNDDMGKNLLKIRNAKNVSVPPNVCNTDETNPLVLDLDYSTPAEKTERRTNMWFSKDAFAGLEEEDDEDFELECLVRKNMQEKEKSTAEYESDEENREKSVGKKRVRFSKETLKSHDEDDDSSDDAISDSSETDESDSDFENEVRDRSRKKRGKKLADFEVVRAEKPVKRNKKLLKLNPEGLAIGEEMMMSRKRRRDLLDDGWNKYTFNDDMLPEWFKRDERKNYCLNLPITKSDVMRYREKQKAIDARPIKKVIEASARKKKRLMNRMEKARKQAEAIKDTTETSDKEKMHQIKMIYKKYGLINSKKSKVNYVVSKKGLAGKKAMKMKGKGGPSRMVDARMKKDDRRRKSLQKSSRRKMPKREQKKVKRKLAAIARQGAKKEMKKRKF